MLSYTDKEYLETKKIKNKEKVLEPPFLELQVWFGKTFGVKPLNFIYEILSHNQKPRLSLIWDTEEDFKQYKLDGKGLQDKVLLIIEKFRTLAESYSDYSAENMFIINSHFSYAALLEANHKIPDSEIEMLKAKLSDFPIWKIMKRRATAIFFFHTEEQAEKYNQEAFKAQLSKEYCELIKKYEDFDYASKMRLPVFVDSKYKIEEVYKGNWGGYHRDH